MLDTNILSYLAVYGVPRVDNVTLPQKFFVDVNSGSMESIFNL